MVDIGTIFAVVTLSIVVLGCVCACVLRGPLAAIQFGTQQLGPLILATALTANVRANAERDEIPIVLLSC